MTRGFMPGVAVDNHPPGANDPPIVPAGVVYHVAVSNSPTLPPGNSGIEWHFYVNKAGKIHQYRSVFAEADAQYHGNSFTYEGKLHGFISIETEGMGEGEWTREQIAGLKRITEWVKTQTTVPAAQYWRVCPDWNRPGIGYHTLFGSPSRWTPVAKSCPGPERIEQFWDTLVPWIHDKADGMSPGEVFKSEVLTSCTKALREPGGIPLRRRVQRRMVVAIRSIARRFPTP